MTAPRRQSLGPLHAETLDLHQLRQRGDCANEARACFAAMIAACYEIEAKCE